MDCGHVLTEFQARIYRKEKTESHKEAEKEIHLSRVPYEQHRKRLK